MRIGRRSLRYCCSGDGPLTVVIEAGAGTSTEHSLNRPFTLGWAKVFEEVEQFSRICIYDRAGVGQSDPVRGARTSLDMARDLHALLKAADVPAPYLLVGHSIGGYNVRVYAREYPKEMAGVVLVDASHPDQQSRLTAVLPPPSPKEPPMWRALREQSGHHAGPEGWNFALSAEQVRASGTLGSLPLVVLSRSPNQPISSETPPEVAKALESVWSELQLDLTRLSTRSSHMIATHASHNVQLDEPNLVVEAIRRVIEMTKLGKLFLH